MAFMDVIPEKQARGVNGSVGREEVRHIKENKVVIITVTKHTIIFGNWSEFTEAE